MSSSSTKRSWTAPLDDSSASTWISSIGWVAWWVGGLHHEKVLREGGGGAGEMRSAVGPFWGLAAFFLAYPKIEGLQWSYSKTTVLPLFTNWSIRAKT